MRCGTLSEPRGGEAKSLGLTAVFQPTVALMLPPSQNTEICSNLAASRLKLQTQPWRTLRPRFRRSRSHSSPPKQTSSPGPLYRPVYGAATTTRQALPFLRGFSTTSSSTSTKRSNYTSDAYTPRRRLTMLPNRLLIYTLGMPTKK